MIDHQVSLLPTAFPKTPKVIFTDVDDTLTWQGELPQTTFTAMHQLKEANISLVPVTGASAGWCDCLLKTWPIKHIIGENGAFIMSQSDRGHTLLNPEKNHQQMDQDLAQLKSLGAALNKKFPEIYFTQDQSYRISDVAFDIGQATDVDPDRTQAATEWLRQQGVKAHASSIHINSWIGEHNKATSAKKWLQLNGLTVDDALFIGDSPNDEAMFRHFPCTVGVANIKRFLSKLDTLPRYITQQQGGFGFAEMAAVVLAQHEKN